MSDYKRGKAAVQEWDHYWNVIADYSDSGSTIEAKIVDYQTSIRTAFTARLEPDLMLTVMPSYIRATQYIIMDLEPKKNLILLNWLWGDEKERREFFQRIDREPREIIDIYRMVGRRHRGVMARNNLRKQPKTHKKRGK